MQEDIYLIWLLLNSGVARTRNAILCEHFKSFKEIYEADEQQLREAGIIPRDLVRFKDKSLEKANGIYNIAIKKKMHITTVYDKDFPEYLRYVYPMPVALFIIGKLMDYTEQLTIGVVGTRECTPYGSDIAYCFSRELSDKGVIIVSGMASGIDSEALSGAIGSEIGIPVAVLGCGADYIYPYENKHLYADIIRRGAIISEYLPTQTPTKYTFPERNRIISGLSRGVLVVESRERGGSLITANCALDQGKDLFVIPGSINSPQSSGANSLLQRGGKAVINIYDILEEYIDIENYDLIIDKCTEKAQKNKQDYIKMDAKICDEKRIEAQLNTENGTPQDKLYNALTTVAQTVTELANVTNLEIGDVSSMLLMLELEGKAISLAGARFKRAD